ncbi:MAG: Mut7-C RNAse domain-containing protein [Candidatus Heimdallarchaeota archaeon]
MLARKKNKRNMKFIVDRMYYRLAKWLRILGYDTLFDQDFTDEDYLLRAAKEKRILITRDENLKQKAKKAGILTITVDAPTIEERLILLHQFTGIKLHLPTRSLPRCTLCNAPIKVVSKRKITDQLKPQTRATYTKFWQCKNPNCRQIYWKGPHWKEMAQMLEFCRKSLNIEKDT